MCKGEEAAPNAEYTPELPISLEPCTSEVENLRVRERIGLYSRGMGMGSVLPVLVDGAVLLQHDETESWFVGTVVVFIRRL